MESQVCRYCGEEKTEDYFYDRPGGLSPICIECEQHLYDRLSENQGVGAYIGLYATCVALNVPFWPDKLPKVKDFLEIEDRWVWYCETISDEVHGENGLVRGFFDGETNILRIFGPRPALPELSYSTPESGGFYFYFFLFLQSKVTLQCGASFRCASV